TRFAGFRPPSPGLGKTWWVSTSVDRERLQGGRASVRNRRSPRTTPREPSHDHQRQRRATRCPRVGPCPAAPPRTLDTGGDPAVSRYVCSPTRSFSFRPAPAAPPAWGVGSAADPLLFRPKEREMPAIDTRQQGRVFAIKTLQIEPNPDQPRQEFEPVSLANLASSLRQHCM